MSITLTNVQTFREVPGRRRTWKFNAFDGLTTTLRGPTYARDIWIPAIGASHPEYPLMQCNGVGDVEEEGSLTSITVTYIGFLYVNGYTQPPVVTVRESETSGSYQVADSQLVNPGTPQMFIANPGSLYQVTLPGLQVNPVWEVAGYVGQVVKIGTYTVNVRYLSRSAAVRYQTQTRPSDPKMQSVAAPYVGYKILTMDRSQLSGANAVDGKPPISVSASHTFKVMCTNFSVTPAAPFAFDCEEVWEWKYLSEVSWFP